MNYDSLLAKYMKVEPQRFVGWGDTVLLIDGYPFVSILSFKPPKDEQPIQFRNIKQSLKPTGYYFDNKNMQTGSLTLREEDYIKLKTAYILPNALLSGADIVDNDISGLPVAICEQIGGYDKSQSSSLASLATDTNISNEEYIFKTMFTLRVWSNVIITSAELPERKQGDIEYIVTLNLLFAGKAIVGEVPLSV